MINIGLIGRQRSGKDTVGDYLVNKYGYEKIKFADGVYKIARDYFNMKGKDRKLLLDIGKKMREIDEDVWLNDGIRKATKSNKPVVITDVRFENEAKRLREEGFYLIRIESPPHLLIKRGADVEYLNDESEVGLNNFEADASIMNDSSIEDLYCRVDTLIGGLRD